jgi:hypothetical protein
LISTTRVVEITWNGPRGVVRQRAPFRRSRDIRI